MALLRSTFERPILDPALDRTKLDRLRADSAFREPPMDRTDGLGYRIYGATDAEYWPTESGPLAVLGKVPSWVDHPRIEQWQGRTFYVAHPYVLGGNAFSDFCVLESAGWRVGVHGASVYYPGATVRVSIWYDADALEGAR